MRVVRSQIGTKITNVVNESRFSMNLSKCIPREVLCSFRSLPFSLPAEVIRRVNALRNLQAEHHKIEAKFFEEVHALECQYLSKYQPLYEKVRSSFAIERKARVFID